MKIIRDVKGREVAQKIGATVDEGAEIYVVVRSWAGRLSKTVPMTLEAATKRSESFSSYKNHGVWIQEEIRLGAVI